jgi:hypothetical protein
VHQRQHFQQTQKRRKRQHFLFPSLKKSQEKAKTSWIQIHGARVPSAIYQFPRINSNGMYLLLLLLPYLTSMMMMMMMMMMISNTMIMLKCRHANDHFHDPSDDADHMLLQQVRLSLISVNLYVQVR